MKKKAISKVNSSILKYKPYIIVALIAFVGAVVTLLIFYPGYFSTDSLWQLCQAESRCDLNAWHPVSMALMWKFTIAALGGKVSGLLLLQVLLLWSSLAILSSIIFYKTKSLKHSIICLSIGILPFVLVNAGVIWKDIQMATSFMLAVMVLITLQTFKIKNYVRYLLLGMSLALITYGVSLRVNAIAAGLPLIWFWIWTLLRDVKMKNKVRLSVISTTALAVVLSVAMLAIPRVSGAVMYSSSVTMYPLDIVNILDKNTIKKNAPESIKDGLVDIADCSFHDRLQTNLRLWQCHGGNERYFNEGTSREDLKMFWRKTVLKHPLRYIAQKAETYSQFLMPNEDQHRVWQDGRNVDNLKREDYLLIERVDNSPIKQSFKSILYSYTMNFGYEHLGLLYKPLFWLISSIALLVISHRLRIYRTIVRVLAISSLLNILSFAPGSITSDMRFIYWSILACLVALVFVYTERQNSHSRIKKSLNG